MSYFGHKSNPSTGELEVVDKETRESQKRTETQLKLLTRMFEEAYQTGIEETDIDEEI